MKQLLLIVGFFSFLFSCENNEEPKTNLTSEPVAIDLLGDWKLNYLTYNKKKLLPSNICDFSKYLGISFYDKGSGVLNVPCAPNVGFSYSKIDNTKISITRRVVTLGGCPPFSCDKTSGKIDGKDFERYNREIVQNNPNIDSNESKTVSYSALRYDNKIDSLIITDDLGNKAVYYK